MVKVLTYSKVTQTLWCFVFFFIPVKNEIKNLVTVTLFVAFYEKVTVL